MSMTNILKGSGHISVLALLDFNGAFNTVHYNILLDQFKKTGWDFLIQSLPHLRDRDYVVSLGNYKSISSHSLKLWKTTEMIKCIDIKK